MKMELKRPCSNCPFRTDIQPYLRRSRTEEIGYGLLNDADFACHKTLVDEYESEGDGQRVGKDTQACAGSMIVLEKMESPTQMMRISERLRLYKRDSLDMNAPVYSDIYEFAQSGEE